jgi:hypothetical protein
MGRMLAVLLKEPRKPLSKSVSTALRRQMSQAYSAAGNRFRVPRSAASVHNMTLKVLAVEWTTQQDDTSLVYLRHGPCDQALVTAIVNGPF